MVRFAGGGWYDLVACGDLRLCGILENWMFGRERLI